MAPLARQRGGCTGWRGAIASFEAWGHMPPLSEMGAGCIGEIRRRATALSVNGEGELVQRAGVSPGGLGDATTASSSVAITLG